MNFIFFLFSPVQTPNHHCMQNQQLPKCNTCCPSLCSSKASACHTAQISIKKWGGQSGNGQHLASAPLGQPAKPGPGSASQPSLHQTSDKSTLWKSSTVKTPDLRTNWRPPSSSIGTLYSNSSMLKQQPQSPSTPFFQGWVGLFTFRTR